jgi:hypothetical protein
MPAASVSVVVLSFDRPADLRAALTSIGAQTHAIAEVIVVDNRSERSGEVARVVEDFPLARLVAHATNLGFTGGMNRGLLEAQGDFVLLTEDDILLAPDAVAALVSREAARGTAAVSGGVMYNRGSGDVRCAGGHIVLGSTFRVDVLETVAPQGVDGSPYAVSYLPGACLFARAITWRRLGGFKDYYFLYMDDVDLCLRAAKLGIPLEVVPTARVWHIDPRPSRPPAWLDRLKQRNLVRVYAVHARVGTLAGFLTRQVSWSLRRLVLEPRAGWIALTALAQVLVDLPLLARERLATQRLTP